MKQFFTQNVKLSSSFLESIKTGKVAQLEISLEGANWVGRATLAYWLKRWNGLYDKIVDNLAEDLTGKVGKDLAKEWCAILNDYFAAGSKDFLNGILLWQETARQDKEMKELKKIPTTLEMMDKCYIKLLFNPNAASWISKALEIH